MKMHSKPICPNRIRGFSLVESLVALVVMSIGMMGIAALYVESLRAGKTAIYRTQAVNLASDMADRIRANATALVAYAGAPANNNCVAALVDCTPGQMAAHDVLLWQQDVVNMMPAGVGNVQFNGATAPPTYTITVTWTEVSEPNPINYALTVQI